MCVSLSLATHHSDMNLLSCNNRPHLSVTSITTATTKRIQQNRLETRRRFEFLRNGGKINNNNATVDCGQFGDILSLISHQLVVSISSLLLLLWYSRFPGLSQGRFCVIHLPWMNNEKKDKAHSPCANRTGKKREERNSQPTAIKNPSTLSTTQTRIASALCWWESTRHQSKWAKPRRKKGKGDGLIRH